MLTNLIHVVLNSTPRSTAIKRNMFRNLLFFTAFILLLVLTASAHGGGSDHDDDDDNKEAAAAAKPDLRSKSLILVKILCFVFIFVGTFVGGVSPYFLNWNEEFLVLGGQFAGGVFLGTAMMHFLRDANETFQDLTTIEYPFAFMLACAGYLLVMLADCVISYIYRKQRNFDLESQGRNKDAKDEMGHSKSGSSVTSLVDSILLIAALCFHSVFEGIAIGIADCTADAWKALWTISIHKIFAAMALVIALLKMIPDRAFISCAAYVFAFGISSPIGVGIGILIDDTKEGRVADWIFAISMGIACGVFVYVSINRLLRGYNQTPKPTSVGTPHHKWLAVMMGIGVIAVVMIWDN